MKIKRVYFICPAFSFSGGGEALHQACLAFRYNGVDATMFYPTESEKEREEIRSRFRRYDVPDVSTIIDGSDTLIVYAENFYDRIFWKRHKSSREAVWWLSVDNSYYHFFKSKETFPKKQYHLLNAKKRFRNASHFYQSEYAKCYLLNEIRLPKDQLLPLYDYLSADMMPNEIISTKRNPFQVLFNSVKGGIARELMAYCEKIYPQLTFVPIRGMTKEEVKVLFRQSGLYIDFGPHPGTDRMPREAAINGCCIITGRSGSANNQIDVPIPEKYKFDERNTPIADIANAIANTCANYSNNIDDFAEYRAIISGQKEQFFQQVLGIIDALDIFAEPRPH